MYSEYFSSPGGAFMPRQIWKTNTQLSSRHQRVNQAPDPAHGGTNEALFEIPAHQLEQQAAPFHQIPQK